MRTKFLLLILSLIIISPSSIYAQYKTIMANNGSNALYVFPNNLEAKYFILSDSTSSKYKILDINSLSVINTLPDSIELRNYELLPDLNNNGYPEGFFVDKEYSNKYYILDIHTNEVLYSWSCDLAQIIFLGTFQGDNSLKMIVEEVNFGRLSKFDFYNLGIPLNLSNLTNEKQTINNFKLKQNYPNPFNPSTTIDYSINRSDNVRINIYDSAGRLVKNLVNGFRRPGDYKVIWDGKNNDGINASSGVYFYQLITKDFQSSKKMILLK